MALPITKGVDDLVYDAGSRRLYASADGNVEVYEQTDPDQYKPLGKVPTGPLGRTSLRSEEHTSELQSRLHLVCRLLLEKKKKKIIIGDQQSAHTVDSR